MHKICAVLIVTGVFLSSCLGPRPAISAVPHDSLCNGQLHVTIGPDISTTVESLRASPGTISLVVRYEIENPARGSLASAPPFAWAVDRGPVNTIRLETGLRSMTQTIMAAGLRPGPHRIDIGLWRPRGRFDIDNSYCVVVPR